MAQRQTKITQTEALGRVRNSVLMQEWRPFDDPTPAGTSGLYGEVASPLGAGFGDRRSGDQLH